MFQFQFLFSQKISFEPHHVRKRCSILNVTAGTRGNGRNIISVHSDAGTEPNKIKLEQNQVSYF